MIITRNHLVRDLINIEKDQMVEWITIIKMMKKEMQE